MKHIITVHHDFIENITIFLQWYAVFAECFGTGLGQSGGYWWGLGVGLGGTSILSTLTLGFIHSPMPLDLLGFCLGGSLVSPHQLTLGLLGFFGRS